VSWSTGYLRRFHDERPGITEDTLGLARSRGVDPYAWLLEPVPPAAMVLDVACGSGPLRRRVTAGEWVGVDASSGELGRARAGGAGTLVRADALRLPVASGAVAAVVCSMALMVVTPLADVLAELRRVLRPGGTAVALLPGTVPVTVGDAFRYARLMAVVRRAHLAYPGDRDLRRLHTLASGAGLAVVGDRRRRFVLALADADAGRRFVRSLYLPGVPDGRVARAGELAASWAGDGGGIGVPLRRVVMRAGT
jgi:SAM-dependent methyltransferase